MKSKTPLRDNLIYLAAGLVAAALMSWLILADLSREKINLGLRIFVLVGTCGALVYGLVYAAIFKYKDEARKPRFWVTLVVIVGLFAFLEWRQARPSFLSILPLLLLVLVVFGVLIELFRYLESKHFRRRRPHNQDC
ncbi:MAG TPA: hypothetical protein VK699_01775 [Terriglobales bacterium]|nr:hypothetical protein [Terriglobales bacterium]